MVSKGIYLTNSAVNSGTAVWLVGAGITYGWKNITKATPVPGLYDVVEVDQAGWENPKITIAGFYDVDDVDSNEISETLLKQFAKAYATETTLTIGVGLTGTAVGLTASDHSTTSIPVVIKTFNTVPTGEMGHIIQYTINLVETA